MLCKGTKNCEVLFWKWIHQGNVSVTVRSLSAIIRLDRPAYSSEEAAFNFWLFPILKGERCSNIVNIQHNGGRLLISILKNEFQTYFQKSNLNVIVVTSVQFQPYIF